MLLTVGNNFLGGTANASSRVSGCCMVSLRALVSWRHVHRGHVGGSVTRLFVRPRLHACDEQLERHDRCAVTCVSLEGHDGVTDWRQTRAWTHWTCIGATILWDPWDASPPTLEIMRTNCIWSPPAFATGCHFVVVRCCGKQTSLVKLSRGEKERRVGKVMGETLKHAITINERRGRDGGWKGRGSAYTAREVPSNFSAVVASMWTRTDHTDHTDQSLQSHLLSDLIFPLQSVNQSLTFRVVEVAKSLQGGSTKEKGVI